MLIKLVEVYEDNAISRNTAELGTRKYSTRTLLLNPESVVCAREDFNLKKLLDEGFLPMIPDKKLKFTRLILERGSNGMEISVIGSIDEFWHAINNVQKDSLLKG
jgi:hypothetical protein